ncbi:formylmethanofuran dehydrogenase subunit E family protein [Ferroplasma sp.]|uniref:formylmethanofuran dehydrogenase subunit E family protein n=1 Tax=Ferroplasma sp. TaxID=2591003 RepID=UPI00307CF2F5
MIIVTKLPVFTVLDTESSHGRYSQSTIKITFDDMVKFHGHACDGLYRGTYALSVGLKSLFPNDIIDRTDIRTISRNSPCLGDAASYLTGARVRFGTQDVAGVPGVWYILQRISTEEAVKVAEEPGFFPGEVLDAEASLDIATREELPAKLDQLKELQDNWVNNILLKTKPEDHYYAKRIDYKWKEVKYENTGIRSDIKFKNVMR